MKTILPDFTLYFQIAQEMNTFDPVKRESIAKSIGPTSFKVSNNQMAVAEAMGFAISI